MPTGMRSTSTSPKDSRKTYQVTSADRKKGYTSREPLGKLYFNSNTNVSEHTHEEVEDTRNVQPAALSDDLCYTRQEHDTVEGEWTHEISQKPRRIISDKNAHVSEQSPGYTSAVPSGSERLSVVSDETETSDSLPVVNGAARTSPRQPVVNEAVRTSPRQPVVNDETRTSSLDCNVCEEKDDEATPGDGLCDSSNRKSQTSFLISLDESARSSSDQEYASLHGGRGSTSQFVSDQEYASLHAGHCSTSQSVSDQHDAIIIQSTCSVGSGTTTSCDGNKYLSTSGKKSSKWDATSSKCDATSKGMLTNDDTNQRPSSSASNSEHQERSAHVDNQQTTRTTTIELNAHSVNSSGRKFSDFSISFLLSQDSPSVSGTIRYNHGDTQQTIPRRLEGHCDNTRRSCVSETLFDNTRTSWRCGKTPASRSCGIIPKSHSCGNTLTSRSCGHIPTGCSCDDCSTNQVTTTCRCEENCCGGQTPASATRCHVRNQSACTSAAPFRHQPTMVRRQYERYNIPTTSSSLLQNEQLSSSLTDSSGDSSGIIFKSESTEDDMLEDSQKTCSTPVGRQLKRPWTDDDANNLQAQSQHDGSLDAPMMLATAKMMRFKYTEAQILHLKAQFDENRYPSYDDLVKMSEDTRVPIRQLQVWFQNKRASTTGTRRPKMKRTEDYLEYETLRGPYPTDVVAQARLPGLALPSSSTDRKGQPLHNGQAVQDYAHQHYISRMFPEIAGHHRDLPMNSFTNGPAGLAQPAQRYLLPARYPSPVYPGTALDPACLQSHLASIYSRSSGLGLGYLDINSLQMLNSYMTQSGALPMAAALPPGYSQLFGLLGNPGVQPTPSVSSPRGTRPADVATSSLLPPGALYQRERRKLP